MIGIIVDETLKTSVDNVYANDEIALYNNFIYVLIAPGYSMAKIASQDIAYQLELLPNVNARDMLPKFTGADCANNEVPSLINSCTIEISHVAIVQLDTTLNKERKRRNNNRNALNKAYTIS